MTNGDFVKRMEKAFKDVSQRNLRRSRAHMKLWLPLEEKIRADIEIELGQEVSAANMWINSGDLQHIRVDYFYETDAELGANEKSGRQQQTIDAIEKATRKYVDLTPEISFHSHQFIQERCGGDYYRYFR